MCSSRWCFLLVVLATIAIRFAVIASDWNSLQRDDDSYVRLACSWSNSGTFGFSSDATVDQPGQVQPTAYRPPAYPWLLSWLVVAGRLNLNGLVYLHLSLGVASVLVVYHIARRLRSACPALPALAVACDPILLRSSQLAMTETLITFAAVSLWAIWLVLHPPVGSATVTNNHLLRRSIFWSGMLGLGLGVTILIRPTMLPWALALIVLQCPRVLSLRQLALPGMTLLVLLSILFPWALRNQRYLGKLIWTTTHGGYTLLLANNPLIYRHFQLHGGSRDWDANPFHARWAERYSGDPTLAAFWELPTEQFDSADPPIDELQDDRLAQQAAVATILRQPQMFMASSLIRGLWFWAVTPSEGTRLLKIAIGLWYAFWFCAALWGLCRLRYQLLSLQWLGPLALVLSLTLIHVVYWSNMRMRAPIMPVVYMLASVALLNRFMRSAPELPCPHD